MEPASRPRLLGSVFRAVHEAVAETNDSRNSQSAEEAELAIAFLDSSVARQEAGLLFRKEDGAGVVCDDGVVIKGRVASTRTKWTSGYMV